MKRDGSHSLIRAMRNRCEAAGAAVHAGHNFLTARMPACRRIELTTGNRRERMSVLWRNREQIVRQLATAPDGKPRGLEAALRGADMLMRVAVANMVRENCEG